MPLVPRRRKSLISTSKRSLMLPIVAADAIHPGYGFLSENAGFADACEKAQVKFIGPPASAMRMMGSKTSARRSMEAAGVPFVPGSSKGLTAAEAAEVAAQVGYPVMLKAAAGGGGKGMRLVQSLRNFRAAYDAASSEAARAFNTTKFISRNTSRSRGISRSRFLATSMETSFIWASANALCSGVIRKSSRKRLRHSWMKTCAAAWARPLCAWPRPRDTRTPGTIEFLVDQQKNFYFLEMNTRLQVEHPVTEIVTGLILFIFRYAWRPARSCRSPERCSSARARD